MVPTFSHEHKFLVGLSIDGPRELHDLYRVDKGGKTDVRPVMRGLNMLKKHKVGIQYAHRREPRIAYKPLEVYRFLKEIGSGFHAVYSAGGAERAEPEPMGWSHSAQLRPRLQRSPNGRSSRCIRQIPRQSSTNG